MTARPGSAATARPSGRSSRTADARCGVEPHRRTGRSGLDLPAVSLTWWQDFGDDAPSSVAKPEQDVAATQDLASSAAELTAIDEHAIEAGIDLWKTSSRQ